MKIDRQTALVAIDVQNDFCPGGRLAVKDGDQVVQPINCLLDFFAVKVFTQDWHSLDHTSFASNHKNREPYQYIEVSYGPQILWPDHCVQGTPGADFHPRLDHTRADLILRKGSNKDVDSYSAFLENDKATSTGLNGYLRDRDIVEIVVVGLATDFCVFYSAQDAVEQGYKVTVLEDCCRGIDLNDSVAEARKTMQAKGITLLTSSEFFLAG